MNYDYQYFSGANVIILVNNEPILETAGISFNELDSQQPVYGYCSRLFDAVLPGQKIIQGKLVINLMDTGYLYKAIAFSRGLGNTIKDPKPTTGLQQVEYLNYANEETQKQLQERYWGTVSNVTADSYSYNDLAVVGPVDIMIEYGQSYQKTLLSVFFIGKSSVIQIDEHVILEEYTFIARDSIDKVMK